MQTSDIDGSLFVSGFNKKLDEELEETLTFYRLPREHHKHLKSTNMLERINLAPSG